MRNKLPELCCSVLPSTGELIIIKRGERGYYRSEWNTDSREENQKIADFTTAYAKRCRQPHKNRKAKNDTERER